MKHLTALLLLFALPAAAETDELKRLRTGEIIIKLTDVPSSRFKRGAVQGVVEAPIDRTFEVITDYDHYRDFMPKAKDSKILEREGNRIRYYSKLGMPWPVPDIWFTTEVHFDADHRTIRFEMVPGTAGGLDRFKGEWKLAEFEGNPTKTLAGYEVDFEPTAHWPKWVVNLGTKSTLGKTLEGIRDRLREPAKAGKTATVPPSP